MSGGQSDCFGGRLDAAAAAAGPSHDRLGPC